MIILCVFKIYFQKDLGDCVGHNWKIFYLLLMHQGQWPVFLILWLLKIKCYWVLCGRGNICWINRGSEEINYIASHGQQTKVSRSCPHCNGSLGKSKSKVGGLGVRRWLVCVMTRASITMHTSMEMEENTSKEQRGRRNKKNIKG